MADAEIRAAVEAARMMKANLPADLADKYIAAGKSITEVKSELCERILGTFRLEGAEAARAGMVAEIAKRFGTDAAASARATAARPTGVDPKTLVIGTRQPAAAGGGSPALTMGQKSMLGVIERTQGKVAQAKAEARLAARAG